MRLANWGNYPVVDAEMVDFSNVSELSRLAERFEESIPRGLGRCYGDASLAPRIISTHRLQRVLAFDEETGTLTCEAGVSFEDLLKVFVPRGWFPPVTPGTKHVTVGGAIAADIHGKNHHKEGSFSNHLERIELFLSGGSVTSCSRETNPELFWATCGGMGLTGMILNATFRLKKIETGFIDRTTYKARDLDEAMDLIARTAEATYSVAWVDCLARGRKLGRSLLFLGEHAARERLGGTQSRNPLAVHGKKRLSVPFFLPSFVLNGLSIKLFNALYFHAHRTGKKTDLVHYDPFFYPLDGVGSWNKIYGRRGMMQYQLVLPLENSRAGLEAILKTIADQGDASFLAVLKLFGKQEGLLSFPMEGYTLALDFPVKTRVFALMSKLDKLVVENGGRIYLAKDARLDRDRFFESYPQAREFMARKEAADPKRGWASFQSKRLGLTP